MTDTNREEPTEGRAWAERPITARDCFAAASGIIEAMAAGCGFGANSVRDTIAAVHEAMRKEAGIEISVPERARPTPPVPTAETIHPDYLISLEDGRRYKSLKRHLTGRGLTPAAYREKWGLPPDYPMVSPNYAKQRSELAMSMGLGKKKPATAPAPVPAKRPRKAA